VLGEGGLDAIDHAVGLGPAERRGEVLHDDGIGVERGEGLAVGLPPPPWDTALRPQLEVGPGRARHGAVAPLHANHAAPATPASLPIAAGTTSARTVSSGMNRSACSLTPPPMMNRSGLNSRST
jgi:hypothetical protein